MPDNLEIKSFEYNPDQPRDDHGRWASTGNEDAAGAFAGGTGKTGMPGPYEGEFGTGKGVYLSNTRKPQPPGPKLYEGELRAYPDGRRDLIIEGATNRYDRMRMDHPNAPAQQVLRESIRKMADVDQNFVQARIKSDERQSGMRRISADLKYQGGETKGISLTFSTAKTPNEIADTREANRRFRKFEESNMPGDYKMFEYNEDQPRDEDGRWTSGGGSSSKGDSGKSKDRSPGVIPNNVKVGDKIQYNGAKYRVMRKGKWHEDAGGDKAGKPTLTLMKSRFHNLPEAFRSADDDATIDFTKVNGKWTEDRQLEKAGASGFVRGRDFSSYEDAMANDIGFLDIPFATAGVTVDNRDVTEQELDEMEQDYDPMAKHKAPVVLGHTDEDADALAWVHKIFTDPETGWRVARSKPTSKANAVKLYEVLQQDGPRERRSPEMYTNYRRTGRAHLRRLSLLGSKPAAIPGQPPVKFHLNFDDDNGEYVILRFKEGDMPEQKVTPPPLPADAGIKALQDDFKSLGDQFKSLQDMYNKTVEEKKSLEDKIAQSDQKVESYQDRLDKQETHAKLEKLYRKGNIPPALWRDGALVEEVHRSRAVPIKMYGDEPFNMFQTVMGWFEKMPVVTGPGVLTSAAETNEPTANDINDKIRAYQTEKGFKSFADASEAYAREHPEHVKYFYA